MALTEHQPLFSKDEFKGFVAELMKALGRAHMKGPAADSNATDNKTKERRASIDRAILRGELAREKQQRVKETARDPTKTHEDLVTALGGPSSVTPLQLARLVKADHTPAATGHDVVHAEAPPKAIS